MIGRVRHLDRNLGRFGAAQILVLLALLAGLAALLVSKPAGVVLVPLIVGTVAAPRLALGSLVLHAASVGRTLRIAWYILMVAIFLNLAQVVQIRGVAGLAVMALAGLMIGTQFWLYSDPRVLTVRAVNRMWDNGQIEYEPHDPDEPDDPDEMEPEGPGRRGAPAS